MKRKTKKFIQKQKNKKKITCLTAYTTSIAKIIDNYVDMILIGDSVGTVIYGMKNTQSVTLEMMMNHGKTVKDSTKKAFTIIDMPYNSFKNKKQALNNARKLLKYTKCQAVKIEAEKKTIDVIKYLNDNKIDVVSHIGVTPQKYKDFKKIRAVGNSLKEKKRITNLAIELEKAGSIIIFLECIKESLARTISQKLKIPSIGIGASLSCDGQVLVINDILMMGNEGKIPRFVKPYTNIYEAIEKSVKKFTNDVENKKFPKISNTY